MEAMQRVIDGELSGVLASAAAGDDVAFGRIVAAYHGEMTRICTVVARDATVAEDGPGRLVHRVAPDRHDPRARSTPRMARGRGCERDPPADAETSTARAPRDPE
jgi:hypothetical protein